MQLLQRHAWWGLLAIAVATVVSGLVDLASGVTWQAVDVTGNTSDEIAVQSSAGAELANFAVRTVGVSFIALGALVCAVLLFAYRQVRIWAWWVMWTLPVFTIANSLLMRAFGAWGPATTGTVVGVVAAVLHLVGAPRFFEQSGHSGPSRPAIGESDLRGEPPPSPPAK
jgi:hypothetical protein